MSNSAVIYKYAEKLRQWALTELGLCVILAIILIILPIFISEYIQRIIVKILIFGIFGLSLNLLWGYTGLFSLGHAAYFGVAGYTVGILTVHYHIASFWIIAPIGILTATLFAAVLAIPALRVSGAYFLLVTLAIGELLSSVALKWRGMTGGSDGLVGIDYPNIGLSSAIMSNTYFYYLVFIFFVVCLLLIYRLVNSPFGYSIQGIRANEARMAALGYNVWLYKYIIFILGGLFAGVAGVLFAYFSGILAPSHLGIVTSTFAMLTLVIGSCTTVFGPVLGSAIVVLLEYIISIYIPGRWPLILGGVFVLTVIFFSGGVGIYLLKLWKKISYGSIKG